MGESPMAAEYKRQLSATLAWCQPRFYLARVADSFRSPELGPPRNNVFAVEDLTGVAAEVSAIAARRLELLGAAPPLADALPQGDRKRPALRSQPFASNVVHVSGGVHDQPPRPSSRQSVLPIAGWSWRHGRLAQRERCHTPPMFRWRRRRRTPPHKRPWLASCRVWMVG